MSSIKSKDGFVEKLIYTNEGSQRLDIFLSENYDKYTRSFWTNMIKHCYVLVNRQLVKAGHKLKSGDELFIRWPEVTKDFADKIEVIYKDENIAAINKPAGMLVHSKGDFNPEYTVADYVRDNLIQKGEFNESNRGGIAHRLDRNTSGVMVVARTEKAMSILQTQFEKRETLKTYVAVVEGRLKKSNFIIDVALSRSKKNPKTFEASANGKDAQTDVHLLKYFEDEDVSLVLLKPRTGRTHQLRVHMKYIGHSIVGDLEYGSKRELDAGRFLLHARELQVSGMDRQVHIFKADFPSDFKKYVVNVMKVL